MLEVHVKGKLTLTETRTIRVMMMPSTRAFSQLPIQKCSSLVKKPLLSAGCMHCTTHECAWQTKILNALCNMQCHVVAKSQ